MFIWRDDTSKRWLEGVRKEGFEKWIEKTISLILMGEAQTVKTAWTPTTVLSTHLAWIVVAPIWGFGYSKSAVHLTGLCFLCAAGLGTFLLHRGDVSLRSRRVVLSCALMIVIATSGYSFLPSQMWPLVSALAGCSSAVVISYTCGQIFRHAREKNRSVLIAHAILATNIILLFFIHLVSWASASVVYLLTLSLSIATAWLLWEQMQVPALEADAMKGDVTLRPSFSPVVMVLILVFFKMAQFVSSQSVELGTTLLFLVFAPLYRFILRAAREEQAVNIQQAVTMDSSSGGAEKFDHLVETLTPREIEVLELLMHGYSNQEISDRLHIAMPTVRTHLRNLYRKTGISNRTELLAWFVDCFDPSGSMSRGGGQARGDEPSRLGRE